MSLTRRMALVLAMIGTLLCLSAGTSSAASLKVASACNSVTKVPQISSIYEQLSSAQITKTVHYCKLARQSVHTLHFWHTPKNRWRLYPRHHNQKCWQIDSLKESVPTCLMVRKDERNHSARLHWLKAKIVQLQIRLFEQYDAYLPPTIARQLGLTMATSVGWTVENGQFGCLDRLWGELESSWNMHSDNPQSSAFGIPQALPGTKMGPRWQTSAWAQIRWGFGYIIGRYGTACNALDWRLTHGYY